METENDIVPEQRKGLDDLNAKIAEIERRADLASLRSNPEELKVQGSDAPHHLTPEERFAALNPKKKRFNFNRKKSIIIGSVSLVALLLIGWFVPYTRHAALNAVGLRGSMVVAGSQEGADSDSVSVKNFTVKVNGAQYESGTGTEVTINDMPFGEHSVEVSKTGYQTFTQAVNVDFNPFFNLLNKAEQPKVMASLTAQGIPVTFIAKDWVSRMPIQDGEFSFGDVVAKPDEKGRVTINVPPTDEKGVLLKADFENNYLSKSLTAEFNKQDQEFYFVPSAKHYFVSKRSGVYSVYSSYIDGTDVKEFLPGTDQESASLQFVVSPSGKYAAMVSTREGRRNADGNLVPKLYWVNLSDGTYGEVDRGEYLSLYDWYNDTIVYSYSFKVEGTNDYSQRLRSLDTASKNTYEVSATTGYFSRVYVALGSVFVAQEARHNDPEIAKGTVARTIGIKGDSNRELATNIIDSRQINFDRFIYQTSDKIWHELNINTGQIKQADTPRQDGSVYFSAINSRNERTLVNFVDGKRELVLQTNDGKTKMLVNTAGISGPVRFLNDTTIIYRLITPTETADYAVSTVGGDPLKVTDVTASQYGQNMFFQYY